MQAFVGRLDHQCYAVLALVTHRAGAVAVPLHDLARDAALDFDLNFIGLALAALDLAVNEPVAVERRNVQIENPLVAVKLQATSVGCTATLLHQRGQVQPEAVQWITFVHLNRLYSPLILPSELLIK
ncbi:hypothetical protein GALL_549230 [mine drainage metagenome]|uniref:Uncharacterized protein n=1 Tax=mine drainage metagenome TaxID=410659 RepID=A0A1J5NWE0_9ZZZZ